MRKIAILGYGTVGSGVGAVLDEGKDFIIQKIGEAIEVKYVLDLRDFPGDPIQEKIVHDYQIILDDPEVEVVVETMGGIHPAFEYCKQALEAGKSVATSNKQLVEATGHELGAVAREHNVTFLFEASVAGGIPIIRTLNTSLWHDKVMDIWGILNGTTNFILDQMETYGISFEEALRQAQEKGYAERNPSADVDGFDAARKIAILASLIIEHHVSFEDVPTRGIADISVADMEAARRLDGTIKLIASFEFDNENRDTLYASVEPMFIPKNTPLYSVNGVYNAVLVHSTMLGDTMYYGKGAGKHATASAVVSDVMASMTGVSHKEMVIWDEQKVNVLDASLLPSKYIIVFSNGSVFMSEECTKEEIKKLEQEFSDKKIEYHIYRVLRQSKSRKE